LVVFFDDDVRIAPSTLYAYEQLALEHCQGSFFGGPVEVDYDKTPPQWLLKYLPASATGYVPGTSGWQAIWFLGANWAAFSDELRKANGFNIDRGPQSRNYAVGQDTEAQRNLARIGCVPIIVPDAKVWHFIPQERCSKRWALQRAHRHGMAKGMTQDRATKLFGLPRWALRRLAECGMMYLLTRFYRPGEARFRRNFELQEVTGVLRGYIRSRRNRNHTALDAGAI
jgi:hypothetical protein